MRNLVLLIVTLLLGASVALAEDFATQRLANWHQWRGPFGNGVSPDGDPPIEWSEERNVKWKVEIAGESSATPIIWQDRVFVLSAVPTGNRIDRPATQPAEQPVEQPRRGGRSGRRRRGGSGRGASPTTEYEYCVICLDRQTGETRWKQVAVKEVPHEGHHQTNTYASGSPTTDGQHLYVSFGSRGIFCFDLDGNQIWQRDFGDMQTRNGFGEGSSPTLHDGTLIVTWDHEGPSFITALDATSGDVRWKVDRDERTTWATPFVIEYGGRAQVVTNGENRVRSYDLKTGELIWECGGQASNPIPTPVVQGDLVFCMTGYRGYALYAIPLNASGDISDSDTIAWHRTQGTPYIASPILYEDTLYITQSRNAILTSLDPKTGEVLSEETRLPGLGTLYASPVAANGRIYYTDRDGTTLVLSKGAELEPLATNKLDEGIDASPAIVGNQMFLRSTGHVYCLQND